MRPGRDHQSALKEEELSALNHHQPFQRVEVNSPMLQPIITTVTCNIMRLQATPTSASPRPIVRVNWPLLHQMVPR